MNHTLSRTINTILGVILCDMLKDKTETIAFPWTKKEALQAYTFATHNNNTILACAGCRKKIIAKIPEKYLNDVFEYIGL